MSLSWKSHCKIAPSTSWVEHIHVIHTEFLLLHIDPLYTALCTPSSGVLHVNHCQLLATGGSADWSRTPQGAEGVQHPSHTHTHTHAHTHIHPHPHRPQDTPQGVREALLRVRITIVLLNFSLRLHLFRSRKCQNRAINTHSHRRRPTHTLPMGHGQSSPPQKSKWLLQNRGHGSYFESFNY